MRATLLLILVSFAANAQLKFLAEDFEGFTDGRNEFAANGIFTFGALQAEAEGVKATGQTYSGVRYLKVQRSGKESFGGWGVGLSRFVQLNQGTDILNFYFLGSPGKTCNVNIELHEDDDNDNVYSKDRDDSWTAPCALTGDGGWKLVSVPLSKFRDGNPAGDGKFNINYYEGKLFVVLMSIEKIQELSPGENMLFDFICFSKGTLPVGGLFEPPVAPKGSYCALGAWSAEGNTGDFSNIADAFMKNFNSQKKLGVVHFFQSFSVEGDGGRYHYPSVERINKVIADGYMPMITLEDHFVNTGAHTRQPNIYSILEGHFDSFFGYWAHHIAQVKGTVLLRILHEFNGDWYPWCTVKNDRKPEMMARTFRYIVNIFRQNNVKNVRFIWCPNSMSVPQESWNYIMEAYPGDEYVDMVGLDIYNGAGKGKNVSNWRSFRKEAIENYFILTDLKPDKPLLICETASRERHSGEKGPGKKEWIADMARALKTDMHKVRLLAWFNEQEGFRINSSPSSVKGFLDFVLKDDYFRSGQPDL